jgi:hypothetical protein
MRQKMMVRSARHKEIYSPHGGQEAKKINARTSVPKSSSRAYPQ